MTRNVQDLTRGSLHQWMSYGRTRWEVQQQRLERVGKANPHLLFMASSITAQNREITLGPPSPAAAGCYQGDIIRDPESHLMNGLAGGIEDSKSRWA